MPRGKKELAEQIIPNCERSKSLAGYFLPTRICRLHEADSCQLGTNSSAKSCSSRRSFLRRLSQLTRTWHVVTASHTT